MQPHSLFNELGLSLVKNGSWIGFSHETEYDDESEIRKYWWKLNPTGKFEGAYVRIWIGKWMFVIARNEFKVKKKNKWAFKLILGFVYSFDKTSHWLVN